MTDTTTDISEYRSQVQGLMEELRKDAVINQLSALGTKSFDRNEQTRPDKRGVFFDEDHLDSLYHFHRLARRIIDTPASDTARAGFGIALGEDKDPELFVKDLQRLKVNGARKEAQRLAHLTGGAGIIPIFQGGGALEEPVNLTKIRRVKYLRVVDRFELTPLIYQDAEFAEARWGKPEMYSLTGSIATQQVHASRVIRFEGVKTRRRRGRLFYNGWGQPILEAVWESLRDVSVILQAIGTAAHEWKYDILKLGNLESLLTGLDGEPTLDFLQKRLDAISHTRSAIRATLLDASKDESLETKHLDFKGIVEAFAVAQQALSADTHQPLTRLWGQSPKGFTSTDDTGEKTWHAYVTDLQTDYHEPAIETIVKWLSASKMGPTKGKQVEFAVVFNPLDLPSEKENAETYKLYSEGDGNYLDRQVLDTDEVKTRFEGTEFKGNIVVEDEDEMTFEDAERIVAELRTDAEERPRAMLALMPSDAFAEVAASHSGEFGAEQMHVTLAFLGRPSVENLATIQAEAQIAAGTSKPLSLKVSGSGLFFNDQVARVLLIGGVGLNELRAAIIHNLEWSNALIHQNHGFIPHMTIDFHDDLSETPEGWEEVIGAEQWPQWIADKLALVVEDEIVAEWPLGPQPLSMRYVDPEDGVPERQAQEFIGYQPAAPNPEKEKCSGCGWFEGNSCRVVEGEIAPGGWCPLWGTLAFAPKQTEEPPEAIPVSVGSEGQPVEAEGKEDGKKKSGDGKES